MAPFCTAELVTICLNLLFLCCDGMLTTAPRDKRFNLSSQFLVTVQHIREVTVAGTQGSGSHQIYNQKQKAAMDAASPGPAHDQDKCDLTSMEVVCLPMIPSPKSFEVLLS